MVKTLIATLALSLLSGCIVPLEVFTLAPIDAGSSTDAGTPEDDGGVLAFVDDLSAGSYHSCAIVRGRIACWGKNDDGEAGQLASTTPVLPTWVGTATNWKKVIAADGATCALKTDSTLWCWGINANGQLGNGTKVSTHVPQKVPLPQAVTSFDFRFTTACAVLADASAMCWGNNLEGQVGLEDAADSADQASPRVVKLGDWRQIATGQGNTCGLRADGALFCWGRNTSSELGLGLGTPAQERHLTRVGTDTDWVDMACAQDHSCARKTNGALWCWGSVIPGPALPVPTEVGVTRDWVSVSLNTFTQGGLRTNNTWTNWGRNYEGQLGLGTFNAEEAAPQTVGTGYSLLATGRFHACAIKDGNVLCTGLNEFGQLGTGMVAGRSATPTLVLRPKEP